MVEGPYIAEAGALIGDPARANILMTLMDGKARTATELAYVAGLASCFSNFGPPRGRTQDELNCETSSRSMTMHAVPGSAPAWPWSSRNASSIIEV